MAYLNKVMVIGNVGKDPEMRFTPSGRPVTSFTMATNRVFTTADGERRKETEWFNIVAWGRQAESCNQFLTKGQQVYVEGELRTRTWEGQDGQKRFRVEIQANRVIFLGRRGATALPEGEAPEFEEAQETIEPEELPF
ncbi:MAG: single-stranded DNA-binding protein [Dehalococcoidia bacterium]|nr:Single-stranded DNA-binding protein [Chloroflexota bacterium]MBT9159359.1 Single-stranded DNA-binding protein [Chloroflexota bacterium]MBT9162111.1 Single-stranded DNA-binding protein [Chloroflexota bacterium]